MSMVWTLLPKTAKSILKLMIVLVLVTGIYAFTAVSDNMNSLQIPSEGARMGNVYYIDATSGMDSNDGLSPERAWKTISKANSAKLNPGDSVLVKRGEAWRDAALREVGEETGCQARLEFFLGCNYYLVDDQPKVVLFWQMSVAKEGVYQVHGEVDEVRWLSPKEAWELLSYDSEKALLKMALDK